MSLANSSPPILYDFVMFSDINLYAHDSTWLNIYIYIYTICRHACFGVYASSVQLCNTSRHVTHPYLSTCECSHQTHVGHGHVDIPRHAQSVMGPECSNYHKGSELCNIANGHPINSAQRVLNNTKVKERNTICRHACFGVYASSVQLCNTSRHVTHPYLSTCECSHQTHVGHGHVDIPRHAQSVMGPECSNYHEGSELCNIANGHPINSAQRVLNNTKVKERNTICRHACFGVYASSVQLCNTSRHVTHPYLSTCECSHQTHVGHGHVDIPRHAQSVMGPECSNYHEGSELCNIANGHIGSPMTIRYTYTNIPTTHPVF